MRKLWSASNVKLYLGAISEADFLRELSELVGNYDKATSSVSYNNGVRSTNHQLRRERILDAAELSALPRGRAVMLSSGTPAALIEMVPWMTGKHARAVQDSIAERDEDPAYLQPLSELPPKPETTADDEPTAAAAARAPGEPRCYSPARSTS